MATTDMTNQTISSYRIAMIEELGFNTLEAAALSDAYYDQTVKDAKTKQDRGYRMRVDHHKIRKMMEAGATKTQVLDILL